MRDNLRRVVDYAANPEKTECGALSQALHYAGNDAKTTLLESAKLVSGIHCRPETAWADMRAVQRKFGKTEGVVAMHAYQSFQPGEVTPEQCHAIGVELARQVWGYADDCGNKAINIHVMNLRRKLGADSVETVRGVGYRFAKE